MTRIRTNTATTQGIVVGTAYVVRHPEPEGEPHVADSATDALSERTRFERALARAAEQLGELIGRSDVFSAHLAIAEDPMLRESVETKIEEGMTAERAVESSCAEISGMMEQLETNTCASGRPTCGTSARASVRRCAVPRRPILSPTWGRRRSSWPTN